MSARTDYRYHASDPVVLSHRMHAAMCDEIDRLRAEVERLTALSEWVRHDAGCSAEMGDEYRCRCGLRAHQEQHTQALSTPVPGFGGGEETTP